MIIFFINENVRISFTPFGWTGVNRQLDRAVSFFIEIGKHLVNIAYNPGLPLSLCPYNYDPSLSGIVHTR